MPVSPSTWLTPLRSKASWNALFVALDPTYGRSVSAVRSTAVNHNSPVATATAAPPVTNTARFLHASGAATATASSIAGSTGAAASILLVKAAPKKQPAATIQCQRPVSAARTPAHTVAVIISVRMASVLLEWLTITEIGATANASAPTVAATRPQRRTRVA